MCVSRMSPTARTLLPVMKTVIRKKPQALHKELDDDELPPAWPDTDGLSGEGAESALAHLRDQENKRIDRSGKDE